MSALQLWLQNHNRRLTQDAIDEALMEYITHVEKQRDELLEQVECSNITEKNMEGRLNKLIVQNAATKDRLDERRDGRLSALEKLAVAEKQRDELLDALERAEAAMEICSDWMSEIEMPDGWTTTTDEKLKISAAIASSKGKQ